MTMTLKQIRIAQDKLLAESKQEEVYKRNKDLNEFAEWCSIHEWYFLRYDLKWYNKANYEYADTTTSQLQEIWELETGRKPLKYDTKCGGELKPTIFAYSQVRCEKCGGELKPTIFAYSQVRCEKCGYTE